MMADAGARQAPPTGAARKAAGSLVTSCPFASWTSAAREPPFEAVPAAARRAGRRRPRRGGRASSARCAREGDAGRRALHGRARQGRRVRRACGSRRGDRGGPRRRRSRPLPGRSRWPSAASWPTTVTRARRPADLVEGGITVRHLTRPVERAGLYAPGGRARYPSTVLMCAAPARRGRRRRASPSACPRPPTAGSTPPRSAPPPSPGWTRSTGSGGPRRSPPWPTARGACPRWTSIAGPGNAYVAEAKRQVSGLVGVASAFAGPSEIVVVAGPGASPAFAAIDLVVQAEHGPDGLAWLVTWDASLADEIAREVDGIVAASSRRADLESDAGHGGHHLPRRRARPRPSAVANAIAPEHLELMVSEEEGAALLELVQNAGAVFVGRLVTGEHGRLHRAGPTTCCRRTARRASRPRCGPTTSASTCAWCR